MSLPPWLHITLVIIGVAFFIIRFIQLRLYNELILATWIASTLLEFVSQEEEFLHNLGMAQVVMLILFLFFTMNQKPPSNRVSSMQKLADLASGDLDKTVGEKYQQKEDEEKAQEEERRRKIAEANSDVEEGKSKDDDSPDDAGDNSSDGSSDGGDGD